MGFKIYGNLKVLEVAKEQKQIDGFALTASKHNTDLVEIAKAHGVELKASPNVLYFRCRLMGYDFPNANGDAVPRQYAANFGPSFIGKQLNVNHQPDPEHIIGKIMTTFHTEAEVEMNPDDARIIGKNVMSGFEDVTAKELVLEGICMINRQTKLGNDIASKLESGLLTMVSQEASTEYCQCSVCANQVSGPFDMFCAHLDHGSLMLKSYKVEGKDLEVLAFKEHHNPEGTGLGIVTVGAYGKAEILEMFADLKAGKKSAEDIAALLDLQTQIHGERQLITAAKTTLGSMASDKNLSQTSVTALKKLDGVETLSLIADLKKGGFLAYPGPEEDVSSGWHPIDTDSEGNVLWTNEDDVETVDDDPGYDEPVEKVALGFTQSEGEEPKEVAGRITWDELKSPNGIQIAWSFQASLKGESGGDGGEGSEAEPEREESLTVSPTRTGEALGVDKDRNPNVPKLEEDKHYEDPDFKKTQTVTVASVKFFRQPDLQASYWAVSYGGKIVSRISVGAASGGDLDRNSVVESGKVHLKSYLVSTAYGQDILDNIKGQGLRRVITALNTAEQEYQNKLNTLERPKGEQPAGSDAPDNLGPVMVKEEPGTTRTHGSIKADTDTQNAGKTIKALVDDDPSPREKEEGFKKEREQYSDEDLSKMSVELSGPSIPALLVERWSTEGLSDAEIGSRVASWKFTANHVEGAFQVAVTTPEGRTLDFGEHDTIEEARQVAEDAVQNSENVANIHDPSGDDIETVQAGVKAERGNAPEGDLPGGFAKQEDSDDWQEQMKIRKRMREDEKAQKAAGYHEDDVEAGIKAILPGEDGDWSVNDAALAAADEKIANVPPELIQRWGEIQENQAELDAVGGMIGFMNEYLDLYMDDPRSQDPMGELKSVLDGETGGEPLQAEAMNDSVAEDDEDTPVIEPKQGEFHAEIDLENEEQNPRYRPENRDEEWWGVARADGVEEGGAASMTTVIEVATKEEAIEAYNSLPDKEGWVIDRWAYEGELPMVQETWDSPEEISTGVEAGIKAEEFIQTSVFAPHDQADDLEELKNWLVDKDTQFSVDEQGNMIVLTTHFVPDTQDTAENVERAEMGQGTVDADEQEFVKMAQDKGMQTKSVPVTAALLVSAEYSGDLEGDMEATMADVVAEGVAADKVISYEVPIDTEEKTPEEQQAMTETLSAYLYDRAKELYANNERWGNKIYKAEMSETGARDDLIMWMGHWADAWLKRGGNSRQDVMTAKKLKATEAEADKQTADLGTQNMNDKPVEPEPQDDKLTAGSDEYISMKEKLTEELGRDATPEEVESAMAGGSMQANAPGVPEPKKYETADHEVQEEVNNRRTKQPNTTVSFEDGLGGSVKVSDVDEILAANEVKEEPKVGRHYILSERDDISRAVLMTGAMSAAVRGTGPEFKDNMGWFIAFGQNHNQIKVMVIAHRGETYCFVSEQTKQLTNAIHKIVGKGWAVEAVKPDNVSEGLMHDLKDQYGTTKEGLARAYGTAYKISKQKSA